MRHIGDIARVTLAGDPRPRMVAPRSVVAHRSPTSAARTHALGVVVMAKRVLGVMALVLAALVGSSSAAFAEVQVFRVHLAPSGDPDGLGVATLRLQSDEELVCYSIVVRSIGAPTEPGPGVGSAHIHGPLPSGGIAIDLDTVFRATGTSTYIARDCVSADSGTIDAVLANPELFYLNVHNVQFPGGAVQGSLGLATG